MISQFHILSPRGDCIISREFRSDIGPGSSEAFFRRVKFWDGGAPPIFSVNDIRFIHVKKAGLYFVFSTKSQEITPCYAIELLNKAIKTLRDFCGVLSEESLRRNFILVYELIDEIIDAGYPQTTASEILKLSIRSDAIEQPESLSFSNTITTPNVLSNISLGSIPNPLSMIPQLKSAAGGGSSPSSSTIPSSANQRPIGIPVTSNSSAASSPSVSMIMNSLNLPSSFSRPFELASGGTSSNLKNEIFVDIIERVTVVVKNGSGEIVNASIDGSIQMKSYLSGNPLLRLALNEDLMIVSLDSENRETRPIVPSSSSAVLDDVIFHECANLDEFSTNRVISLTPPDGEFVLMNYRIGNFGAKIPFRIFPTIERQQDNRVDVAIVVRADIPEQNYASNLIVALHVPEGLVTSVTGGASGAGGPELVNNTVCWTIKKLVGGQEHVCRAKIACITKNCAKFLSHVSLSFEIPMYSLSNMQIKYLRINSHGQNDGSNGGPYRWIRYVTQSHCYASR